MTRNYTLVPDFPPGWAADRIAHTEHPGVWVLFRLDEHWDRVWVDTQGVPVAFPSEKAAASVAWDQAYQRTQAALHLEARKTHRRKLTKVDIDPEERDALSRMAADAERRIADFEKDPVAWIRHQHGEAATVSQPDEQEDTHE